MIIADKVANKYDTTLEENTLVKIGGDTGKFVPNINMQKWNDECWLNINHPDVVGTEKESLSDEKISLVIGEKTHRYYVKDGRVEYEIEFTVKPATNKVEFDLSFSAGLEFCYQPPLTQKEIDDGHHRPENVVGSYAVYWSKKDNKYKTGKFCHIYRPKLIDADGKETWANMFIVGKKLTITMPQVFLDVAKYPVLLDPELGYSTKGASNFGGSGFFIGTHGTTDGDGGDMSAIHCFCVNVGGAGHNLLLAVYTDDVSNEPHEQVTAEASIAVAASFDGQKNSAYSGALAATTKYWVVVTVDHDDLDIYYDDGKPVFSMSFIAGQGFDLPTTMPGGWTTGAEQQYSTWVDYGAAPPPTGNPVVKIMLQMNQFNGGTLN